MQYRENECINEKRKKKSGIMSQMRNFKFNVNTMELFIYLLKLTKAKNSN